MTYENFSVAHVILNYDVKKIEVLYRGRRIQYKPLCGGNRHGCEMMNIKNSKKSVYLQWFFTFYGKQIQSVFVKITGNYGKCSHISDHVSGKL